MVVKKQRKNLKLKKITKRKINQETSEIQKEEVETKKKQK